ncbi:MAG TPA: FAD-dependent oxidoreductase, partial [Acetobacteraceae bacterium]|nr:FAD-dependent oxidoreductase [Acetobacteraceae bacterium]
MSPPVDPVPSDPELPASADAVVIGGGIIGAASAYYLAKKGHSVALLEKGRIAGEQSSRNWGWCRQQNRDERELPLIIRSLEIWGGLADEIGADTGFRRNGLIYVTRDPAELARWEEWLTMARQYQVHSRILSAQEARARTPGMDGDWIGGIESPTDGRGEPSMAGPAL